MLNVNTTLQYIKNFLVPLRLIDLYKVNDCMIRLSTVICSAYDAVFIRVY